MKFKVIYIRNNFKFAFWQLYFLDGPDLVEFTLVKFSVF